MEVIVANPRKLRAICSNDRKSDDLDALMPARLARVDPALLHPVEHRSEQEQRDLLQVKLRDNLVRQRQHGFRDDSGPPAARPRSDESAITR